MWDHVVYSQMFTGHLLDIRGGFVCITDYKGTQANISQCTDSTVDTASSYEDLISWHGDKLALIGLDDPVITVSFFDEIPLNPDKCYSDNRMYRK